MNYKCTQCGYSQDFEMNEENITKHFPEMPLLQAGDCPGCYHGQVRGVCNWCGHGLDTAKECKECKKDFKQRGKLVRHE